MFVGGCVSRVQSLSVLVKTEHKNIAYIPSSDQLPICSCIHPHLAIPTSWPPTWSRSSRGPSCNIKRTITSKITSRCSSAIMSANSDILFRNSMGYIPREPSTCPNVRHTSAAVQMRRKGDAGRLHCNFGRGLPLSCSTCFPSRPPHSVNMNAT